MPDYSKYTEQELVSMVKSSDEYAFVEIFERFWPLLHRNALRMLGDIDEANDAVQDVLATLWEKRTDISIHTSLPSYLYAATRNRVLLSIRRTRISGQYLATLKDVMSEGTPTTDHRLNEKELASRFEEELSQLPPKMREAFELSRIHEHSYREIAEKMNLSDNTVKHHISNALKVLRSKLGQLFFFFL